MCGRRRRPRPTRGRDRVRRVRAWWGRSCVLRKRASSSASPPSGASAVLFLVLVTLVLVLVFIFGPGLGPGLSFFSYLFWRGLWLFRFSYACPGWLAPMYVGILPSARCETVRPTHTSGGSKYP